jgi:hypothetical protein
MTEYQKQRISWLEYRSQVTGKTVEELRAEMSERARLGGLAGRGKKLSEEHKRKLSEAVKKNVVE